MARPDVVSGAPVTSRSKRGRRRRRLRRAIPIALALVIVAALTAVMLNSRGTSGASTSPTLLAHVTTTTIKPYVPNPVPPIFKPALAGEGRWAVRDLWRLGPPSVATTWFRNTPSGTIYASWMRAQGSQIGSYLGYKGPGPTSLNRGPEMVPLSGRVRLLATFNSGFYESDSAAGFYTHGTLYFPMINDRATLVAYGDGRVDVINWQAGRRPPPGIVVARQNLHLLVNDSKVLPSTSVGTNWGLTLHGVPYVWRTGIGIDRHGNLIYAAGSSQSAASLAQAFVHLGCVRAMELDINPEWPIFVTYGAAGAGNPRLEVPNPNQVRSRFLYTSTKDFFALYVRQSGQSEAPW